MNAIDIVYEKFCTKRFPLPAEEHISNVQSRIKVSLPPAYRWFLLRYNGGLFKDPVLRTPDGGLDALQLLQGVGTGAAEYEFGSEADLHLFEDNHPPDMLPIGYTVMGKLLVIVVDPVADDRGFIFAKKPFSADAFVVAEGIDQLFAVLIDTPSQ